MEFEKTALETGESYWTWRDVDFLPYAWLAEDELGALPRPIYIEDIHPDCHVGFPSESEEGKTNEILLPNSFDELRLDPGLRKDLRRVEKKNASTHIAANEEHALKKASPWFLEQWGEEPEDFKRRMHCWKNAQTLSAYAGERLLGVHITLPAKDGAYYLGCWWDSSFKSLSVPTFLLKKDIEHSIARNLAFYDLGVGSEPYKKKWGIRERQTRYYAALPSTLAKKIGVKHFIEIP